MQSDLFWIIFGRILTALISIASLRIMTSLLEPRDFGIYALLVSFQGLCGLLLINPVGQHINRHTHSWWDDGTLLTRLGGYNRYLIVVSVGIAFVVLVWWLLYPSTGQVAATALLSALAVGSIVYLGTWNGTFVYALNMLGFRMGSIVWMLVSSLIGLGLSSIFAYQYRTGTAWMLGQALGLAVGATGAGLLLRRYQLARKLVESRLDKSITLLDRKTILVYCVPLAAATGLMWMQSTGYRFWVGEAWGMAELGMLAIGLNIASQIWAIAETLSMQFLTPYLFRHITGAISDQKKSAILSDMVNVMWPLYALLAGFNMVFASSLLYVLTNERYHAAVPFVMCGILIEFTRCTSNLWSYAAQIERRTTKYIAPYGLGAIIVWLGALCVSYMQGDILIMAVVLAISSLVMCITMVFIMQRMLPVRLDVRGWIAGSLILTICFLLVIFVPIKTGDFIFNIESILIGLTVFGGFMLIFLWRNGPLKRLISVSLGPT